jgi:hypothetical protein
VQIVSEAQLNDLTLTWLQAVQDGVHEAPEFSLPLVTIEVGQAVVLLADHQEWHGRV